RRRSQSWPAMRRPARGRSTRRRARALTTVPLSYPRTGMRGVETASLAVVDASVPVKWVVDEPGSDTAAAFLARPIRWIAPRLMLVEAAATLRRKVVQRELRVTGAAASLRALLDAAHDGVIQLVADEQLVDTALLLALE